MRRHKKGRKILFSEYYRINNTFRNENKFEENQINNRSENEKGIARSKTPFRKINQDNVITLNVQNSIEKKKEEKTTKGMLNRFKGI